MLTITTSERHHRSAAPIVVFEYISQIILIFSLLTFKSLMPAVSQIPYMS